MTFQIVIANEDQHASTIRELFWEYLDWANERVKEEFQVSFEVEELLEDNMKTLSKFMPPYGRIALGYVLDRPVGIACLKKLTPGMGEIKRMYVRPENRKQGLGQALINCLIQEARQIGYQQIRLDSARFMEAAHKLYRSIGFNEIAAYEGSEIPPEFQQHWIFMEMSLEPNRD